MTDTLPNITLSVQGIAPQLRKDEQGGFSLCFDLPGWCAAFALDAAQVRALGLLCLYYFPDIEPRYAVPSEEEAWRLPARKIGLLDDRSLQILLRETQSEVRAMRSRKAVLSPAGRCAELSLVSFGYGCVRTRWLRAMAVRAAAKQSSAMV